VTDQVLRSRATIILHCSHHCRIDTLVALNDHCSRAFETLQRPFQRVVVNSRIPRLLQKIDDWIVNVTFRLNEIQRIEYSRCSAQRDLMSIPRLPAILSADLKPIPRMSVAST